MCPLWVVESHKYKFTILFFPLYLMAWGNINHISWKGLALLTILPRSFLNRDLLLPILDSAKTLLGVETNTLYHPELRFHTDSQCKLMPAKIDETSNSVLCGVFVCSKTIERLNTEHNEKDNIWTTQVGIVFLWYWITHLHDRFPYYLQTKWFELRNWLNRSFYICLPDTYAPTFSFTCICTLHALIWDYAKCILF